MKKRILAIAAAVVVLAAGAAGFSAYRVLSAPEYALASIAADMKKSGLDGLEPHLTGDARTAWELAGVIGGAPIVEPLLSALGEHYADDIRDGLSQIEWELGEVLKGRDRAELTLNFRLPDRVSGSIPLTMVRMDGEWLISEVGLPDLEEIHLQP